jgi:predicted RNA binding protein YcfA (HicA-like mRNA interferase family)
LCLSQVRTWDIYCEGQRVWNWKYKGFQFVIQTGSKEIYMRMIPPQNNPKQAWFPELLLLSCARPLKLPFRRDLLSQFKGKVVHPRPESLPSSRLATHGIYCESQRVWNWRNKGFQFVIQTGSKEIYMRTIPPQNN